MSRYNSRGRDPYWITVRFSGVCKCGKPVAKGEQAFYYPNTKTLCGKGCGCADSAAADFASCAFDDAVVSGGGIK